MTGATRTGYYSLGMPVPTNPKIYHIVHVDRLSSIVEHGCLWCDRVAIQNGATGTTIGMSDIKQRRLNELTLNSHPSLYVGDCVPFYFCPRSVMLYVLHMANHPNLPYRGGQGPIIHLEADLNKVVSWADVNDRKWAFTTDNAATSYFDDYSDLEFLGKIDWNAVSTRLWSGAGIDSMVKSHKQAEFLAESSFPWELIERIGVASQSVKTTVQAARHDATHQPPVDIMPGWYY